MAKKLLALVLALSLVFCLFACSSEKPEEGTTESTGNHTQPNGDPEQTNPQNGTADPSQPEDETTPGSSKPEAGTNPGGNSGSEGNGGSTSGGSTSGETGPSAPSQGTTNPADPDKAAILGVWGFNVIAPEDLSMEGVTSKDRTLIMTYDFKADGSMTWSFDQDSLDELFDALRTPMSNMFKEELRKKGLTPGLFEFIFNTTVEEYVGGLLDDSKKELADQKETFRYSLENGILTINGNAFTYTLSGDKLVLDSDNQNLIDTEKWGVSLPLTLNRMNG